MPFGKHKGEDLQDIPLDYLAWVLANCDKIRPDLRNAIRDTISRARFGTRTTPPPPPPPPPREKPSLHLESSRIVNSFRDSLRDVYREMAFKNHPDRGGSTQVMAALNEMHDRIEKGFEDRMKRLA